MYAPIVGYEGLYEMSAEGRVRNARTYRIMPVKSGRVTLSKQGLPAAVLVGELAVSTAAVPAALTLPPLTSRLDAARSFYGAWANSGHVAKHNGAAGEYLVCAALEQHGVSAALPAVNTAEYDFIGDFGRGNFFTIQVKSTSCATEARPGDTPAYRFRGLPANPDACDVYAFVALDTGKVVFMLAQKFSQGGKNFKRVHFEAEALVSVQNVLQTLHAR
jgi:hypothetical protein